MRPLRAKLDQKDPQVIAVLGILKDRESVDALVALLNDANNQVRPAAAQALGAIRDPRAVEPLIEHLTKNWQDTHDIARALGEIKDPRAIGPLIDAARQTNLQGFSVSYREPIDNPVAWPLVYIGFPAIEPLAGALGDQRQDVREVAAWALAQLRLQDGLNREDLQPAIGPLTVALADRSEIVRNYAAITLAHLGNTDAVDVMLGVVAAGDERSIVFMNAPRCFRQHARSQKCDTADRVALRQAAGRAQRQPSLWERWITIARRNH